MMDIHSSQLSLVISGKTYILPLSFADGNVQLTTNVEAENH